MKTRLTILLTFLWFASFAQFGSSDGYEVQKVKPEKVIPIKDTVPDLFTEIEAITFSTGMTSSKIIFRSFGKKVSENSEIMGGAGAFTNDKSIYITLTHDKELKSWIFAFINVSSGKIEKKVKFQPSFYKTLGQGKIQGTNYVHVGNSKSKTENFVTLVDCNTGETINQVDISALRIGANAPFSIIDEDRIIITQEPDKKLKTFDSNIASNLVLMNIKNGDTRVLSNKIFTDNKNNPKDIHYDGKSVIYVTYNDYKPFIVTYDISLKEALLEIREPKGDMGKIQCITPDNKFLFLLTRDVIDVWSIDEKRRIRLVSADPTVPVPYSNFKISPDGTKISAIQTGFGSYGLEAKDNLSVWTISELTK